MSSASKKAPRPARKRAAKRGSSSAAQVLPVESPEKQFEGPERILEFADSVQAPDSGGETATAVAQKIETWVTFRLLDETFALPVSAVQEILRVKTITRVPHAPFAVRGIINMRGRVVPVVDFRVRLGLPSADVEAKSRILITNTRNRVLGLLTDSVEQVVRLDRNAVKPLPDDVMTDRSEFIVGTYDLSGSLLILLDVERVLLIPGSLAGSTSA